MQSLKLLDFNEARIWVWILSFHNCSSAPLPTQRQQLCVGGEKMVIHYAFRRTLEPDVDEVDIQSSPSQMDSNSAVSSSTEHRTQAVDNEQQNK